MIRKFGIRAHDLGVSTPEQVIEQLNILELDGVHLAPLKVFDAIKTHEDFTSPITSSQMIKPFHEHKKEILLLGCYLNHTHPVEQEREKFKQITKKYIDIASIHGLKSIGTESFTLNANGKPHQQDHTEFGYRQFLRQMEPLMAYAESKQIEFAIEPVSNHIIFDIKTLQRLKNDLKSSAFKIIFDPVNIMTSIIAQDQIKFYYNFFEKFETNIILIHLKDFIFHGEEKQVLSAGLGSLDYEALIECAKSSGQMINITLEGVEQTRLENAVRFMKR